MADERRFPIMGGPSVPWALIEPHERQAIKNHDQALARLAQRGGLAPCEAVAVLEDRKWRRMGEAEAKRRLVELIDADATRSLREELAALRARAEKAERELAIFRDPHRLDLCKHDVLQRDCRTCSPAGVSAARFREAVDTISALRVVATRYMDALERYGEHDGDCAASVVGAPGDAPCTCGYEAALAATGDEEGKGGDR